MFSRRAPSAGVITTLKLSLLGLIFTLLCMLYNIEDPVRVPRSRGPSALQPHSPTLCLRRAARSVSVRRAGHPDTPVGLPEHDDHPAAARDVARENSRPLHPAQAETHPLPPRGRFLSEFSAVLAPPDAAAKSKSRKKADLQHGPLAAWRHQWSRGRALSK